MRCIHFLSRNEYIEKMIHCLCEFPSVASYLKLKHYLLLTDRFYMMNFRPWLHTLKHYLLLTDRFYIIRFFEPRFL